MSRLLYLLVALASCSGPPRAPAPDILADVQVGSPIDVGGRCASSIARWFVPSRFADGDVLDGAKAHVDCRVAASGPDGFVVRATAILGSRHLEIVATTGTGSLVLSDGTTRIVSPTCRLAPGYGDQTAAPGRFWATFWCLPDDAHACAIVGEIRLQNCHEDPVP
jgi:hypothetical protein